MNVLRYSVTGGDNGAYGPAFGPVNGAYAGTTLDERGQRYLLLQLDKPLELQGKLYRCFAVTNRSAADSFEHITEYGGAVGIGGTEVADPALLRRPLDFQNEVFYLAVGEVQPAGTGDIISE